MKLWKVFVKSMREQLRDPLTLSLSVVLAPLFVFLYWMFFPSGSTTYPVYVINEDMPVETESGTYAAGTDLIEAMQTITYADDLPILNVSLVDDQELAEARVKDRKATLLVVIPAEFSATMYAAGQGLEPEPVPVTFVGDLTNPYYAVAAVMAGSGLENYVQAVSRQQSPVQFNEIALGGSAARSEFEIYVPGILVFAVIILVFQSAMVVAYEVEAGTLRRLKLTRLTSFDLLGGISLSIILIGVVCVLLAFLVAYGLGFRSQGPLWVAILVGAITTFAVIGSGLIVAAFSKTVSQAFIIANFPLVLFMFFSSAVFPVPNPRLFEVGKQTIGLFDILPTTHAVVALNKVLTLGVGLDEVTFELIALIVLSVTYFLVGVWLFQRNHMRAA
ncbi:MAG: ABC transporter permease [Anaerolineales bacterium]|nr:ABC transporter permease [Anaerolineales bacterium]